MKPLRMLATSNCMKSVGTSEIADLSTKMFGVFLKDCRDMYVINEDGDIRCAGYSFIDNMLDEKTIICNTGIKLSKTIWFKIDDYESHYVGTFLLPADY